jgi:hypothetical protein
MPMLGELRLLGDLRQWVCREAAFELSLVTLGRHSLVEVHSVQDFLN